MINTNLSEREREILELLAEDASVTVARMSDQIGVSAVTIRSTLNSLANKGIIIRTWGGAAPAFHPSVIERQGLRVAEKNRIAQQAASMVEDGDTVMIEAGTTTSRIANFLLGKRDVKVVSNSTLVLPFARINPGLNLTLVGGEFRPATESMVGPLALAELDRFHVRLAFVGTDGFSLEGGLTTHLVEGAEIVRKMAECSEHCILVADSAKYGQQGFVKVLSLNVIRTVITDNGLSEEICGELRETGVEVIRV